MQYTSLVDTGKTRRKKGKLNEDSVGTLVFEDRHLENEQRSAGLFVLADGAGGHGNGEKASYLATTVIPAELNHTLHEIVRSEPAFDGLSLPKGARTDPPSVEDIENRIAESIKVAGEEIFELPNADGACCTVLVGLYAAGRLHLGWTGDSPGFLVNETDGTIEKLTRDHSPVQREVENGHIDPTIAMVHRDKNQISQAVGNTADTRVETNTIPLYADDTVLFTSDGLVDAYDGESDLYREYLNAKGDEDAVAEVKSRIREEAVTPNEIRDRILAAPKYDIAAERLVSLANERGGSDNLSVILFGDSKLPEKSAVEDAPSSRAYGEDETDLTDAETVVNG